jgi:uncharacterized protein YecE (DUF72 family)
VGPPGRRYSARGTGAIAAVEVQDTGLGEQAGVVDGIKGGLEQGDVVAVGAVDGPADRDVVALLESGWYPPEADTPERRLRHYARQFALVEVNATYYALPAEQTAAAWAARTPAGFTFNVKAFSLFTHHPTPVAALPADLRPAAEKQERTASTSQTSARRWPARCGAVPGGAGSAAGGGQAGRDLAAVPAVVSHLGGAQGPNCGLRRAGGAGPGVYRVPQPDLDDPRQPGGNLTCLAGHRLAYVGVDMPQGHRDSISPVLAATAPDLAVVRLHGHSDRWESKDIHGRFGYRYTETELAEWAPKVTALAGDAEDTHVLLNNCYRDYAQVNAQRLAEPLGS